MRYLVISLVLFSIASCSTHQKSEKKLIVLDRAELNCNKIAILKASGFSIIPFIGQTMAKSILEDKAKEMKANAILITKNAGFFYSELEADGFHCKEVATIKI